jgi:hypothetical protein
MVLACSAAVAGSGAGGVHDLASRHGRASAEHASLSNQRTPAGRGGVLRAWVHVLSHPSSPWGAVHVVQEPTITPDARPLRDALES